MSPLHSYLALIFENFPIDLVKIDFIENQLMKHRFLISASRSSLPINSPFAVLSASLRF